MKRNITLVLILALVLSLAFPTLALAKRGGVPANGKDKGKPAAAAVEPTEDDGGEAAAPDKDKKDKKKDAVEPDEGAEGVEPGDAAGEDGEEVEQPEKLTGVENALSRLQRNLERMQAQMEAGRRDGLPEGLQSAIAKFMSWLGIDPASEEAENTDEGSTETSGTVEPEPVEDEEPDTGADEEVLEESAGE